MMKLSVGVDLHKGQFTVYWRSEGVTNGRWEKYSTGEKALDVFVGKLKTAKEAGYECEVAVESTGNTRHFKRRVEEVGVNVRVINTLKFKVVNESVKKTDRHDAATIAEFLEKDMLPEARLCSVESEELRRILKTRKTLVRTIVTIKNQLHGLLLSYGIETEKGSLQSKKGRRAVLTVLAEHNLPGEAVLPLIETIERIDEQVKKIEKLLEEKVKEDRMVELIRTIPGAGLITAATVRAYTDDIKRFPSYKQYSAYAGLAPWVQNSNNRERIGGITKRGPEELRTALVQIVLGMVRNKRQTLRYRLMSRYGAMKQHKGSGKTIIATARKLSKVLWYMLHNDQPFDPAKMIDPQLIEIADKMSNAASEAA
jgi:transposase